MFFQSDNWAGVHPSIAANLSKAGEGFAAAYGNSDADRTVLDLFSEVFERDVSVYFVGTGTAANSLALAAIQRPGGAVFSHCEAHVIEDECGAPDFFSGMRMAPVAGRAGRIELDLLSKAMGAYPQDAVHHGRSAGVTITQATEMGTVYSLDQISALSEVARSHNVPVHMDGARFANALVSLDTSPAEMTWRRGVDLLSFGATKNGCWCAEAIVCFNQDLAADLAFIQKRSAQLFSKSRFVAAQFEAYFADGLWLALARHANRMADQLRERLTAADMRLAWPTTTNEVFAILPKRVAGTALGRGAHFYEWPVPSFLQGEVAEKETLARFVTSFATTDAHVDELLEALKA
ncbi:threonine aldolase [Rhizobium sp. BK650]|uniref:threonine aldolase family protein n=1 Tax=Rhizobium sp. BK650 TaxID=2586990 RepID=UPI00160BD9DD|nr:low specificity L-threonine aldolase [Rhizobium sp. BK650]MBB3660056.1 threonine aldolase [Rhizobium sp. BK650]